MDVFFNNMVKSLGHVLIQFLPVSPFLAIFARFRDSFGEYLAYVNWFCPVDDMIGICTIWLGASTAYYAIMAMLRWTRLI